ADVIHEAREDFDPVTARSAELLADQLDRFESLLADLLEISRFDAGAAALEAEPIDLREVVRRVVGGAEPLAERKGTRIRILGDQQPVVAEADARRVGRVLRNLVGDAVEHGEGAGAGERLPAAGGAVAVAVPGYGIRLTRPRTADEPLRGSPIALEPKDSRRNRGLDDAGLPRGGDGEKRATVPVQPPQAAGQAQAARDPLVPRTAAEPPTADPTALPG